MARLRARKWLALLPAVALALPLLSACENGTHLAEAGDKTAKTPVTTSTAPTTAGPTTTSPTATETTPTVTPPTTKTPPPTTPTHAPPSATGSAGSTLSLGTSHLVGKEFRVSIASVDLNANQEMELANEFNPPPHGRYVLAALIVVYLGNDEGHPWIDLRINFAGSDARQYDSSACGAVVAHPGIFVPTLERGGRAHYQVCWDVPVGAIPGAKIFVEQTFRFDSPRLYWKSH